MEFLVVYKNIWELEEQEVTFVSDYYTDLVCCKYNDMLFVSSSKLMHIKSYSKTTMSFSLKANWYKNESSITFYPIGVYLNKIFIINYWIDKYPRIFNKNYCTYINILIDLLEKVPPVYV